MAKRRTKHCKYPSKYAPDTWLNIAQYLAEEMCERLAKRHEVTLTTRFWERQPWAETFRVQLYFANSLRKVFSETALLNGIHRSEVKHVYSLGAKHILNTIFKQEENKLRMKDLEPEIAIEEEWQPIDINEKPRQVFTTNKSARGLDG